ncbi:MAG: 5-formyltetrahydrofolate cyclo-ligase [Alphaproteobacteria bacterium]|nr:5-formyltetrahydrofolate cyclo-ligase [Alphaproteobacteria bacterium]
MTDLIKQKQQFRQRALKACKTAHMHDKAHAATQLAAQFMACSMVRNFLTAETIIGGYVATGHEIDPTDLLKQAARLDMQCALPIITADMGSDADTGEMVFKSYQFGDQLNTGKFGILEPSAQADSLVPQLILVPLIAFDKACNRLGRGGGHYDRYLKKWRAHNRAQGKKLGKAQANMAIGLAYEAQGMPAVPCQPHDEALDMIITPTNIVRPTQKVRP